MPVPDPGGGGGGLGGTCPPPPRRGCEDFVRLVNRKRKGINLIEIKQFKRKLKHVQENTFNLLLNQGKTS